MAIVIDVGQYGSWPCRGSKEMLLYCMSARKRTKTAFFLM